MKKSLNMPKNDSERNGQRGGFTYSIILLLCSWCNWLMHSSKPGIGRYWHYKQQWPSGARTSVQANRDLTLNSRLSTFIEGAFQISVQWSSRLLYVLGCKSLYLKWLSYDHYTLTKCPLNLLLHKYPFYLFVPKVARYGKKKGISHPWHHNWNGH